jgi:hypothetical protein
MQHEKSHMYKEIPSCREASAGTIVNLPSAFAYISINRQSEKAVLALEVKCDLFRPIEIRSYSDVLRHVVQL